MSMTWEYVITEADKGIKQLSDFIEEDLKNADKYEYKMAILQWYKSEAIKQQNSTIHATLEKIGQ